MPAPGPGVYSPITPPIRRRSQERLPVAAPNERNADTLGSILETEVGRLLFERDGRRILLAKAGQRLLDLQVRIQEEPVQTLGGIRDLTKDCD